MDNGCFLDNVNEWMDYNRHKPFFSYAQISFLTKKMIRGALVLFTFAFLPALGGAQQVSLKMKDVSGKKMRDVSKFFFVLVYSLSHFD